MKTCIGLLLTLLLIMACNGHEKEVSNADSALSHVDSMVFDSVLAKKLGADEIGMKNYVMAFLKKGPKRDHDSATAAEIQKGHMANIGRMAREGKLILAGPFMDDGDIRGIYVFNVESIEEAEALTNTDPAIVSGRLVMELHPWYGSAALMEVNAIHDKVSKKKF